MLQIIELLEQLAEIFFVISILVIGFGLVINPVSTEAGSKIARAGLYALSGSVFCMIGVALMS